MRGHNIFAGYLNNPQATAEVLVDGWFRSGDLGVNDEDGFLSIVDRKKDLIIRGGFNVYPREVEEVLAGHPGVAQVAVVAVPNPHHGEEICAVVIRSPDGGDLEAATLIDWSKERLGRHKYPRRVEFFKPSRWGRAGRSSNGNWSRTCRHCRSDHPGIRVYQIVPFVSLRCLTPVARPRTVNTASKGLP